jgi:hypothetical protein
MIYLNVQSPTTNRGVVTASAMAQGQWGVISGLNTTYDKPKIWNAANVTGVNIRLMAPVLKYPIDDYNWQEMMTSGYQIPSGTQCLAIVEADTLIEDHDLYWTVGNTIWSGTTQVGAKLMLNASGFPTIADAGGATVIGTVEKVDTSAGIIWYRRF